MAEDFINAYLEHTKDYETPGSFWRWSGYFAIAATLRNKCYLRFGDSPLFPNLYMLLLAESSGHRKNRPVELSNSLVANIPLVKAFSGRASVQAILDELARSETDSTGKVIKSSCAAFFAPELSAGIVTDSAGLATLTDIYDYKPVGYQHKLRTGPSFDLKDLVFSMFAASNQDMLQKLFDQSVIRGGFLARTLLVVPNEFRPANSLFDTDYEALKKSKEHVMSCLKKVNQMTGEFKFERAAQLEYNSWYKPFRDTYLTHKEVTNVRGRIHAHILKIAMILAANDLANCVLKKHVEQAIVECLELLPNYKLFAMGNTKTDSGQAGNLILTDLCAAKDYMLSRKVIIRNHWQDFDADVMEKVITSLEEAGYVRLIHAKDGIYYQLTPLAVKSLLGVE